jgi:hypothetical protein
MGARGIEIHKSPPLLGVVLAIIPSRDMRHLHLIICPRESCLHSGYSGSAEIVVEPGLIVPIPRAPLYPKPIQPGISIWLPIHLSWRPWVHVEVYTIVTLCSLETYDEHPLSRLPRILKLVRDELRWHPSCPAPIVNPYRVGVELPRSPYLRYELVEVEVRDDGHLCPRAFVIERYYGPSEVIRYIIRPWGLNL